MISAERCRGNSASARNPKLLHQGNSELKSRNSSTIPALETRPLTSMSEILLWIDLSWNSSNAWNRRTVSRSVREVHLLESAKHEIDEYRNHTCHANLPWSTSCTSTKKESVRWVESTCTLNICNRKASVRHRQWYDQQLKSTHHFSVTLSKVTLQNKFDVNNKSYRICACHIRHKVHNS